MYCKYFHGSRGLRELNLFSIFATSKMKEDHFIYKVAGWLIAMLFTLQPAGQYETLSDDPAPTGSTQFQLEQQESACIDEPSTLHATFTTRLRQPGSSAPHTGNPSERYALVAIHPNHKQPVTAGSYVRRRSTLCTYRL